MSYRRALSLLGVLFSLSSLVWGQRALDRIPAPPPAPPAATADTPPAPPAAATEDTPPVTGAEQSEDEPVSKLQELFVLFNGESALSSQVVMGGWGSIQTDPKFNPFIPQHLVHTTYALYISTQGRYRGVRFDFPQALPAAKLLRKKNVYLELYLRTLPNSQSVSMSETPLTSPLTGMPGAMGPRGGPGMMGPRGGAGAMGPMGAGGPLALLPVV